MVLERGDENGHSLREVSGATTGACGATEVLQPARAMWGLALEDAAAAGAGGLLAMDILLRGPQVSEGP